MRTEVFTVQQIARRLRQPEARIKRILRRQHIEPAARIGNVRLFAEEALEIIEGCMTKGGTQNVPV